MIREYVELIVEMASDRMQADSPDWKYWFVVLNLARWAIGLSTPNPGRRA